MVGIDSPHVAAFIQGAQKIVTEYHQRNFKNLAIPTIRAEDSQKYIRVFIGGSIYCFIAKDDNETKALGKVKGGDVLKAATYTAPAKGARSSLFDADFGVSACEPHGVRYFRG